MYLEHVNLTVADLEKSITFYQAAFGYSVRWKGETSGGAPAAHVGDEKTYLALFQASKSSKPSKAEPDYGAVGINHFGFIVNDLAACRDRLEEIGVSPHHDADYEPGLRLYFFDPDGIEIELVEYPSKS